jgi:hypothetical protein
MVQQQKQQARFSWKRLGQQQGGWWWQHRCGAVVDTYAAATQQQLSGAAAGRTMGCQRCVRDEDLGLSCISSVGQQYKWWQ